MDHCHIIRHCTFLLPLPLLLLIISVHSFLVVHLFFFSFLVPPHAAVPKPRHSYVVPLSKWPVVSRCETRHTCESLLDWIRDVHSIRGENDQKENEKRRKSSRHNAPRTTFQWESLSLTKIVRALQSSTKADRFVWFIQSVISKTGRSSKRYCRPLPIYGRPWRRQAKHNVARVGGWSMDSDRAIGKRHLKPPGRFSPDATKRPPENSTTEKYTKETKKGLAKEKLRISRNPKRRLERDR